MIVPTVSSALKYVAKSRLRESRVVRTSSLQGPGMLASKLAAIFGWSFTR